MKKLMLAIGILLPSLIIKGQVCGGARNQNISTQKLGTPNSTLTTSCTATSTAYTSKYSQQSFYVPTANDPLITVKVTFHIFNDANGNGSWPQVANGQSDIYQVASWMHDGWERYSNTRSANYTVTGFNPAYIHDSRVNYEVTNIYFYNNTSLNTESDDNVLFSYINSIDPNRINEGIPILFNNINLNGATGYQWYYNNAPYVHTNVYNPPTGGGLWGSGEHLRHEIGHCVGWYHTYNNHPGTGNEADYADDLCTGPDFLSDVFPTNNPNCPSGSAPCNVCWEDVGDGKGNMTGLFSNNVMGGQFGNEWTSPLQMGRRTRNLHLPFNGVRKFVKEMTSGTAGTWQITSNETWDFDIQMYQDIFVTNNSTLTLKCKVAMAGEGKIIVDKGSKLVIDGATVTSWGNQLWSGIEVWGDNTKNQAINTGTGMPTYQGMVVLTNGAKIENAECGIVTIKNTSGTLDWSKTGGIIQAVGATFNNNVKDVGFMYYQGYNSASYFKGCNFQLTNQPLGWPDARVSLYGINGVLFYGNNFTKTASTSGTFYGIQSNEASYSLLDYNTTQNSFNGFEYGIYAANSSFLVPVSVTHAVFGNTSPNKIGNIYLSNANYSNIVNCTFNVKSTTSISTPDYGLYLNTCTGYTVRGNTCTGVFNSALHTGIYVNNSGPYSNTVYNNTFTNLYQGLWAAEINQGAVNNVQGAIGLVMNCNNFTNCTYNIGVQATVSNAGVQKVQGVSGSDPNQYVRNKYNTASCTNQNRYFISGANSYGLIHASFTDAACEPTPQPTCGSSIISIIPSGTYSSTYCPAVPGGGGGQKQVPLSSQIEAKSQEIYNLEKEIKKSPLQSDIEKLSYLQNELGTLINEKIHEFLNDTTNSGQLDSIIVFAKKQNTSLMQKVLLGAYMRKGDYLNAQAILNELKETDEESEKSFNFLQALITLNQNQENFFTLKNDTGIKSQIEETANNGSRESSIAAQNILQAVFKNKYQERILLPEVSGSQAIADYASMFPERVKIYPNPNNGSFTIETLLTSTQQVEIYDVTGKMVLNKSITGNTSINAENLPEGIYNIKITGDGVVTNKRIVITK